MTTFQRIKLNEAMVASYADVVDVKTDITTLPVIISDLTLNHPFLAEDAIMKVKVTRFRAPTHHSPEFSFLTTKKTLTVVGKDHDNHFHSQLLLETC